MGTSGDRSLSQLLCPHLGAAGASGSGVTLCMWDGRGCLAVWRAVGVQALLEMSGESSQQSSQGHSSGSDLLWEPGMAERMDPTDPALVAEVVLEPRTAQSPQPCATVRGESSRMGLPLHLLHPQPDTPKEQSLRERCKRELEIPVPPLSTPG